MIINLYEKKSDTTLGTFINLLIVYCLCVRDVTSLRITRKHLLYDQTLYDSDRTHRRLVFLRCVYLDITFLFVLFVMLP